MNSINGIGGAKPVNPIESDPQRVAKNSSAPPAANPAASASFSKPGELFGKLQQLEQQDPEKLKEVAGNIADSLRKEAAQAGASGGFLDKLASQFDEVAKTGTVSALQTKGGPSTGAVSGHHGHHHGHHAGGSGDVVAALQTALDQVNQALTPPATTTATTPPAPVATT